MKEDSIKSFLERKGITLEECTPRQKQILKMERPAMWDYYTWDLSDTVCQKQGHDPQPLMGMDNMIIGYICSMCGQKV